MPEHSVIPVINAAALTAVAGSAEPQRSRS